MTQTPGARLQRLLGGEHLAALRRRLRQRYERAEPGAAVDGFRMGQLSVDEHAALAALLGRPPRFAASMQVDAGAIDAALQQSGIASSLREALEQLDGPITNPAAERGLLHAQWHHLRDTCEHPALAALLQIPAGLGLLKRLSAQGPAEAARLLLQAQTVLLQLPAQGLTRAQLAASILGDAHALDTGYAVATLVLAVLRRSVAPVPDVQADSDPENEDASAEAAVSSARDVWASAGVLVNELARPALFLNLPVGEASGDHGQWGEPRYMSLRRLLRSPPAWGLSGRKVYICENPNLLAIAADRLGPHCAPLVCTDGMPAAAQRCLLTQLVQAGAKLHYHGDFDWPGLRIGNHVMREHGAQAWCFGSRDYLAAVHVAARPGRKLEGDAVSAGWDDGLAIAMQEQQLAIDEEAVAQQLLRELGE